MESKTFRAPTIMQALEQVQEELGPEALVVSVREAPTGPAWQVWRSHGVEVVAMAGNDPASPVETPSSAETLSIQAAVAAAVDEPAADASQALASQVERLQKQIHSLSKEMDRLESGEWPLALNKAYGQLIGAGVDPAIARKAALVSANSLGTWALEDQEQVRTHLSQQLTAGLRIRSDSVVAQDRIVFAVGARGVGKTAALAKIARAAVRNRKRVVWICADTNRMGAIPEAQAYAEALGIEMKLAYTPAELAQGVDASSSADLTLVDTSGCNPYLEREVLALGAALTAVPARTTYVVAPATAKDSDLLKLQSMAAPFSPAGIILTKLDETRTPGSSFNLAWRSQWPLVYFTDAPQVLEGFHRADPERLVHAIFREGWMQ